MAPLSHSTEAAIAWMLDLGRPVSEIANRCGVCESTVRRRERQSGEGLDFCPWVARQARAIQAGWDAATERSRTTQQPDPPEIPQVSDRLFEGPEPGESEKIWASIWYAARG
jgi:transposase-like protein